MRWLIFRWQSYENASGSRLEPEGAFREAVAARWPPFGGNGRKLVLFIYTAANLNESQPAMTAAVQPSAPLAPLPCAP
jgi:hypothetical protein